MLEVWGVGGVWERWEGCGGVWEGWGVGGGTQRGPQHAGDACSGCLLFVSATFWFRRADHQLAFLPSATREVVAAG